MEYGYLAKTDSDVFSDAGNVDIMGGNIGQRSWGSSHLVGMADISSFVDPASNGHTSVMIIKNMLIRDSTPTTLNTLTLKLLPTSWTVGFKWWATREKGRTTFTILHLINNLRKWISCR